MSRTLKETHQCITEGVAGHSPPKLFRAGMQGETLRQDVYGLGFREYLRFLSDINNIHVLPTA